MENYLAGVGVQPLGCFEFPVQAVFPLPTPLEPATCRNCAAIAFSKNGESIAPLVPAYTYFTLHLGGRFDFTLLLGGSERSGSFPFFV